MLTLPKMSSLTILILVLLALPQQFFCEYKSMTDEDHKSIIPTQFEDINLLNNLDASSAASLQEQKYYSLRFKRAQQIEPKDDHKPDHSNIVIESPTLNPRTEATATDSYVSFEPESDKVTTMSTTLESNTGMESTDSTDTDELRTEQHEDSNRYYDVDEDPSSRSRLIDTWGRPCNNTTEVQTCVHTTYMYCRFNMTLNITRCECRKKMERAPIRIGEYKGTIWCLVKDTLQCTDRDTKDEDCVSGRCERNNKCARITDYFSGAQHSKMNRRLLIGIFLLVFIPTTLT